MSISDYINNIADGKEQRALQAVVENIGTLVADDSIRQSKLDRDYVLEEFETPPIAAIKDTGAAPTGATGEECILSFQENTLESHVLGAGQTIVVPVMTASGLNIAGDQVATEGFEICAGILANNRQAFVVGTSPAFFFECEIAIADVSGTSDCAVGFRKVEAYQANIDDYADMAALNVIAGAINIETIVGGAGTTTTDTTNTWADAAKKKLKVMVSGSGVVTYEIAGSAPTTTAAFTLTSALTVVPFVYMLNDTDLVDTCHITSWECGLQ